MLKNNWRIFNFDVQHFYMRLPCIGEKKRVTKVRFDDIINLFSACQVDPGLRGVMSRIQAHQNFAGCKRASPGYDPMISKEVET